MYFSFYPSALYWASVYEQIHETINFYVTIFLK